MDFYIETPNGLKQITQTDFSEIGTGVLAVESTTSAARGLIGDGLPEGNNWVTFVLEDAIAPKAAVRESA